MKDTKRIMIKTAKEAAKIIMSHYEECKDLEYIIKTNFRTKADLESNTYIRQVFEKNFPEYEIYSEETNDKKTGSNYKWIIDPLDGTIPFTFGISDHFSIAISLVKNYEPVIGVINAPLRKELYFAEKGKGAFVNNKQIHTSNMRNLNKVLLAIDYGKFERNKILKHLDKFLSKEGICYPVSYGCASVSLALVASGKLHGYTALKLEPWDMAAAVIINREAGSKVTDMQGKEWDLSCESILCANPKLHSTLLKIIMEN